MSPHAHLWSWVLLFLASPALASALNEIEPQNQGSRRGATLWESPARGSER